MIKKCLFVLGILVMTTAVNATTVVDFNGIGKTPEAIPKALALYVQVNGKNAAKPGPIFSIGSHLTWNYTVTNDGNTPLHDVTVRTRQKFPFFGEWQTACSLGTLDAGSSAFCEKLDLATEGSHISLIIAHGSTHTGETTESTFKAFYQGNADINQRLIWKRGIALELLESRDFIQEIHTAYLTEINDAVDVSVLHAIILRMRASVSYLDPYANWNRGLALALLEAMNLNQAIHDAFLNEINLAINVNRLGAIITKLRAINQQRSFALELLEKKSFDQVTHDAFQAVIHTATSVNRLVEIIDSLRIADADRLVLKRGIALQLLEAKSFDQDTHTAFLAIINAATNLNRLTEIIDSMRSADADRLLWKRDIALQLLEAKSFDQDTHTAYLTDIYAAVNIRELHAIIIRIRAAEGRLTLRPDSEVEARLLGEVSVPFHFVLIENTPQKARTLEFRLPEAAYVSIGVFGFHGGHASYDQIPLYWWLKENSAAAEILYSGGPVSWEVVSEVSGQYEYLLDTDITTIDFSEIILGDIYFDEDIPLPFTPFLPDGASIVYTNGRSKVFRVVSSLRLQPGAYAFTFSEAFSDSGKTSAGSSGIVFKTHLTPLTALGLLER